MDTRTCNQTDDLLRRCTLRPHALYRLCQDANGERFEGSSDHRVMEDLFPEAD